MGVGFASSLGVEGAWEREREREMAGSGSTFWSPVVLRQGSAEIFAGFRGRIRGIVRQFVVWVQGGCGGLCYV